MEIVEERRYVINTGYSPADFFALYKSEGMPIQTAHLGRFLAYYVEVIGTPKTVISLWRYPSLDERATRRGKLAASPDWNAFLVKVRPLLQSMSNRILVDTGLAGQAPSGAGEKASTP